MRLTFGRLATDEIERGLVRDHGYAPADARRLALLAGGSVGAALALGSGAFADAREAAVALLRAAGAADLTARLAVAKSVVGDQKADRLRQEVHAVLRVAASLVRDVSVVHAGSEPRLLANGDIEDVVHRLARALPPPAARAAFATLERALDALDRNAGPKLVVEWVAAEI
jgi:hypothetical protein